MDAELAAKLAFSFCSDILIGMTFTPRPLNIIFLVAILSLSQFSFAQEVLDITHKAKVAAEDSVEAKRKLLEDAVKSASLSSIQTLIGAEKAERSKAIILEKILKQSDRYILSTKSSNLARVGAEFSMDIDMKLSLKNLRVVLLENGLLYQMDGPPKILPVIQFVDRIQGMNYGWWFPAASKESPFLKDQLEALHKSLREKFKNIGFYALAPIQAEFFQSVPEAYRSDNLQRSDYLFLGEYFKSSIVVRGNVTYRLKMDADNTYIIEVKLEALHAMNGRILAEVEREFQTDAGDFRTVVNRKFANVAGAISEDLGAQLSDAWKKGTFGASLMKLAVLSRVTPLQLEEFKKTVVLQIRDIKGLRERWVEARKTTYEIDSSVLPTQLAQAFRTASFQKYKVEVDDVSTEGITITVQAK